MSKIIMHVKKRLMNKTQHIIQMIAYTSPLLTPSWKKQKPVSPTQKDLNKDCQHIFIERVTQ